MTDKRIAAVKDDEPCWMCDKVYTTGPEPQIGFLDNGYGLGVGLCSDKCSNEFDELADAEANNA